MSEKIILLIDDLAVISQTSREEAINALAAAVDVTVVHMENFSETVHATFEGRNRNPVDLQSFINEPKGPLPVPGKANHSYERFSPKPIGEQRRK